MAVFVFIRPFVRRLLDLDGKRARCRGVVQVVGQIDDIIDGIHAAVLRRHVFDGCHGRGKLRHTVRARRRAVCKAELPQEGIVLRVFPLLIVDSGTKVQTVCHCQLA